MSKLPLSLIVILTATREICLSVFASSSSEEEILD
jgi:hypothetical protein